MPRRHSGSASVLQAGLNVNRLRALLLADRRPHKQEPAGTGIPDGLYRHMHRGDGRDGCFANGRP